VDFVATMAASRCAGQVADGSVELRAGGAERTGCVDASMDAVISVNNVMLWDHPAGFIDVELNERPRRLNSPAVELLARRPGR
jgi:hypothetical protein